jgi:hypothetical protein
VGRLERKLKDAKLGHKPGRAFALPVLREGIQIR